MSYKNYNYGSDCCKYMWENNEPPDNEKAS